MSSSRAVPTSPPNQETTGSAPAHVVVIGDRTVQLTPREAGVLGWLMAHPDQPVTRRTLLREVWGYRGGRSTRVVDMTVARVRRKIERDPSNPSFVVTIQGVGYRFCPGPTPTARPAATTRDQDTAATPAGLDEVLAQLGVFGERAPRHAVAAVVDWPEPTLELGPWGTVEALVRLGLARHDEEFLDLPGATKRFRALPTALRRELAQRRARWVVRLRGDAARRCAPWIDEVIDEALVAGDLSRVREGLEALASFRDAPSPIAEARLALHEGRLAAAEVRFRAAMPAPAALAGLGWLANLRGENERAKAYYKRIIEVVDGPLAVRAFTDLAVCAIEMGNGDEAWGHLEQAAANAAQSTDPAVLADLWMTRGYVALMLEKPQLAETPIRLAERLYREMDEPRGVAWALNNLGESHRLRDDGAAAGRCYAQSLEWFRAAGCTNVIVPLANLALLDLQAGRGGDRPRLRRAVERLEIVRARADSEGRTARAGRSALLLAHAQWALGERQRALDAVDVALDRLSKASFFENLVARETEGLAALLRPTAPSRATALARLAVRQWRGLRRADHAARVVTDHAIDDADLSP